MVADLIDLNKIPDYSIFLIFFCSYLLILWLVISLWVGSDAAKRFEKRNVAVAFTIMTFFLNFPMLIFYLIIRPDNEFADVESWETGGVNVPVVNFKGKDGISMVLELKINPAKLVGESTDMKVDVSWDSARQDMDLMPSNEPLAHGVEVSSKRGDRKISNVFGNWSGLVRKQITRVKEVSNSFPNRKVRPTADNNIPKLPAEQVPIQGKKNKKKKKKKNRK